MPVTLLHKNSGFPPTHLADEDGLLAIGGDLSTERLLNAYRQGIFPWFNEDEPICWWFPNPRFVLFPAELKISGSMKTIINKGIFKLTVNRSFENVIHNCSVMERKEQPGTWLSEPLIKAYVNLHLMGVAHSAEAWKDGVLVGGLYGVIIGKVFFGESMFSKVSNASKFAFIQYVKILQNEGIQLIDCQVYTPHLQSLGARMIDSKEFETLLHLFIS